MKKKLLSSLLIGAFVFGVGAANVQPVSADALDKAVAAKEKYDKAKDKFDKAKGLFGQKQDGDSSNRPEPPKDENGNPLPPPDGNKNGDSLSGLKDKYDSAKDKYKTAKELFKK